MEEVFPSLLFAFGAPFLSLSGPARHLVGNPAAVRIKMPQAEIRKFIDAATLVLEEKLHAIFFRLCSLCGLGFLGA